VPELHVTTFTLDIAKWVEKTKGRIDLFVRKLSLDLFTRIVLRSPIDTGRFRGNWQLAIGQMPEGVLELDDKTGAATIAAAQAVSLDIKAGDIIYLINNLPYANRLENGWSKQAPAGMVGLAIAELDQAVNKAATESKTDKP
jgi:hypothetical protein